MILETLFSILPYSLLFSSITCFILGLKKQTKAHSASLGNKLSILAMLFALGLCFLENTPKHFSINVNLLILALLLGSVIGLITSKKIAMTRMPELVALFNGFGGLSSMLVGLILAFYQQVSPLALISLTTGIFIGALTFTGSIIAWLKLSEIIKKNLNFKLIKWLNMSLLISAIALIVAPLFYPVQLEAALFLCLLSAILGCFFVLPIGGGDMPVVIALLNSFSGLAASAAGFAMGQPILIVAGTLVGASGLILTIIMCKAMNRRLSAVLFSQFGSSSSNEGSQGNITELSIEDSFYSLEAAQSIVIVPGYGLAVAQAQHALKELVSALSKQGADIKFGVHPVAGRMPGHMNVLLAEAQVDYEQLFELEETNEALSTADICIVVGANDVVNPDALENKSSPIYGMPIIEAHKAKTVFVLKRSMKAGFAGIENPLFFKENTRMIFGDAKATLQGMLKACQVAA